MNFFVLYSDSSLLRLFALVVKCVTCCLRFAPRRSPIIRTTWAVSATRTKLPSLLLLIESNIVNYWVWINLIHVHKLKTFQDKLFNEAVRWSSTAPPVHHPFALAGPHRPMVGVRWSPSLFFLYKPQARSLCFIHSFSSVKCIPAKWTAVSWQ